jgi:hypothetical protein
MHLVLISTPFSQCYNKMVGIPRLLTGDSFSNNLISGIGIVVVARGSVVVKALCYKPEGRGFET